MREKEIISFVLELAEKVPSWQQVAQQLVQSVREGQVAYSLSGRVTVSLFSDRIPESKWSEDCRLTVGFTEEDIAVGLGDCHAHFTWEEEGDYGRARAFTLAMDFVEERFGVASIRCRDEPRLLWIFNTHNSKPLTDFPLQIVPPRLRIPWPWLKREYQLVTNSHHGTFNDRKTLTRALAESWEIPRDLWPPKLV